MASWSGLRVFISGPMRGKQFFNYPAFFEAAHRLRRMGHVVVNPAEIGESFGKPEEINADPKLLRQLITDELAYIPRCDAIYLLPGWQESEGALRELQVALALKLRVFVDPVDRSGRDWNDTTPPGIGIPDTDFGHREAPHGAESRAWHSKKENEDMKQVKKPAKKAVTNVKKSAKTVKNVKTPAKKAVVNKAKKAK